MARRGARAAAAFVGAALVATVLGAAVLASPAVGASVVAKKSAACALLTSDEVSKIVGTTASAPRPSTSPVGGASVCDYDTGGGIGTDGGGMVVVQVYTGTLGRNIYNAAKKRGEKVGSVYWDGQNGIATTRKKNATIATSYTEVGVDAGGNRDIVVALAAAAAG